MGNIITSWKTTLLGLVVGGLTIATQTYTQGMSWKAWVTGVAIAIWGMVQKDANVTGGTIPATKEAETRTTATAAAPATK
jgi:hypothetical protein